MKIIITGASRGIGYDTALTLAAHDQHRILALSRNTARLDELKKTARERHAHNPIDTLPFDLTNPDWPQLAAAVRKLGGVDILINNAGLLINKPFAELDAADWQRLFAVNFFSAVDMIQRLLPELRRSEQGHILNVSSMGGFQGSSKFPGLTGYSTSKAALSNLTECLAEEFKDDGIAVNCLALGAVQTEMLNEAFPGMQAPVSSENMASFMAYFATQGHTFFNGKVLPVSVSTP